MKGNIKMFKIVSILLFFISLNVYSASGQSGNGSNGCWVEKDKRVTWLTIEQLKYNSTFSQFKIEPIYDQTFTMPNLESRTDEIKIVNLTETLEYRSALGILYQQLFLKGYFQIYNLLNDFSLFFDSIYFTKKPIKGIYSDSPNDLYKYCHKNNTAPALLSFPFGATIASSTIWQNIQTKTKVTIIIHELFRLLKIYHPAAKAISDNELRVLVTFMVNPNFIDHERAEEILFYLENQIAFKLFDVNDKFAMEYELNDFVLLYKNFYFWAVNKHWKVISRAILKDESISEASIKLKKTEMYKETLNILIKERLLTEDF